MFTWLSEPINQEAVDVLRANDYDLIAADVQGVIMSPEKQLVDYKCQSCDSLIDEG